MAVEQAQLTPPSKNKAHKAIIITIAVLGVMVLLGFILGMSSSSAGFGNALYTIGLAGYVGFGTNWLAIKMLFHPRKKTFGIQGVVPRKRNELAARLSELIEEHLISGQRLHHWLEDRGSLGPLIESIQKRLPELIDIEKIQASFIPAATEAMKEEAPELMSQLRELALETIQQKSGAMGSMLMPALTPLLDHFFKKAENFMTNPERLRPLLEKAAPALQSTLMKGLNQGSMGENLENILSEAFEALLHNAQFSELIREEILKQDERELEAMIHDATNEQLVFLQIAGGFLGALAGFAILWPWLLLLAVFGITSVWWIPLLSKKKNSLDRTQE